MLKNAAYFLFLPLFLPESLWPRPLPAHTEADWCSRVSRLYTLDILLPSCLISSLIDHFVPHKTATFLYSNSQMGSAALPGIQEFYSQMS